MKRPRRGNSPHRDLILKDLFGLRGDEGGDIGLDVTRGHRVGTCEANPFNCQRSAYNGSKHEIQGSDDHLCLQAWMMAALDAL